MNTGIFETTILPTLTLPKAKVKAKVKARARKDRVKDQVKEKAKLKVKKIVPLPLLPLSMPQQPKGKARNNHTTQPPLLLPFQWPGLSLWQVPPYFLSIISPPSAHPHGPACHCGRSRLATNTPNPLPSHLYTQPSVIPTFKARLVIVAGPALRPTPPIVAGPASSIPTAYHFTSFYHSHPLLPSLSPACHCGRSRLISLFYPSHHSVSLSSLSLSLSSLAALRAPAAMGDPKWSCWRSATLNPQVILLATHKLYKMRLLPLENLAVLHSPDDELHWLTFA